MTEAANAPAPLPVEHISKMMLLGGTALYLSGLLIVITQHAQYGIFSASLLRVRYVWAGLWFTLPAILGFVFFWGIRTPFLRLPSTLHSLAKIGFLLFYFLLATLILEAFAQLPTTLVMKLAVASACWATGFACARYLRNGRLWPQTGAFLIAAAAPFVAAAFLAFVFYIYAEIPSRFGGGALTKVRFVFSSNHFGVPFIVPSPELPTCSVPYYLVTETENAYFIYLATNRISLKFAQTLELPKSSVAGILRQHVAQ